MGIEEIRDDARHDRMQEAYDGEKIAVRVPLIVWVEADMHPDTLKDDREIENDAIATLEKRMNTEFRMGARHPLNFAASSIEYDPSVAEYEVIE